MSIAVELVCDIMSPSGYSAHARELIKCLDNCCDLYLKDSKHDSQNVSLEGEVADIVSKCTLKPYKAPAIRIQFETPEFYTPVSNAFNIGFVQWETTKIPDTDLNGKENLNWVKQMNKMDMIWTSSSMSIDAFQNSGVTVPIELIPGPIDTQYYVKTRAPLMIPGVTCDREGNPCKLDRPVLGLVAQWTPRKNIEDFLIVCFSEFTTDDFVILLKTYGSHLTPEYGEKCLKKIKELRALVKNPNAPDVVAITENMTDDQMASLYQSMDFIVNTSRGEGFCLPLAQGMASGAIPITNKFSAPMDYVDEGCGFLVDYILEPAIHMPTNPWYRFDQKWGRVIMEDLAHAIRKAIKLSPASKSKMALAAQSKIHQVASPGAIDGRILYLLEEIEKKNALKV
jgi:glycosyltransferase involved in cell wall biosynthesis